MRLPLNKPGLNPPDPVFVYERKFPQQHFGPHRRTDIPSLRITADILCKRSNLSIRCYSEAAGFFLAD